MLKTSPSHAGCPFGQCGIPDGSHDACAAFARLDADLPWSADAARDATTPRVALFDATTLHVAIRVCDPFQCAHGPAYHLARIAEILHLQPEVA